MSPKDAFLPENGQKMSEGFQSQEGKQDMRLLKGEAKTCETPNFEWETRHAFPRQ
jgi:hypothetical protein